MGLKQEEIAQIQSKSWELDCCRIKLACNSSTESFEGPGYIKSTSDGGLSFKLYCTTGVKPWQGIIWWAERSGKLIPPEKCYRLIATDVHGRLWEAENILPDHGGALVEENTAIFGRIHTALKSTNTIEWPQSESSLDFICFGKYEIPCNTVTKKYEDRNGKPVEIGGAIDAAKFNVSDFNFSMANKDGRFVINIIAKNSALIDEHAEFKVAEALMFVLGKPINWTVLNKAAKNTETTIIRPIRYSKKSIYSPLRFAPKNNDYAKLYIQYFNYIRRPPDKSMWHPMSILLHRVIEAQQSSIENRCLILSVAIEGILLNSLPDLAKPTDNFLEQLSNVKDALNNLQMADDLSNRFIGTVNSMTKASASDKLRELLKLKIITDQEFKTWKSIRNSSTHPEKAFFDDFEEAFDNFNIMLTMCYKIIFYCIEYSGLYTDYSGTYPTDKKFES